MVMKSEFKKIVKDTLKEYDALSPLHTHVTIDILTDELEKRIKEKFHIFRINKILTGDSS